MFTTKLREKYRDLHTTHFPSVVVSSIQHPHQKSPFIFKYEPTLIHYNHPSPWFPLGFVLGVVHSMDLNKCITMCIYYYGIIKSIFTTLHILCTL